ncbi:hypothetical protein LSAT2_024545 [Lamellibrachia satsuma]|nr:hypothetical protein LSAT2_024545 [Lamellibrachia satsuma]
MNLAAVSFTSLPRTTSTTPNPTHGFLDHVLGQHDIRRFSPTTYDEIRDVNEVWHQIVAFFDSGSDTTLIKSSLAKPLGLVGTSELFHYGVAGGSKLERSTRYTLQVRPRYDHKNHGYALEAMGIKQPAHNSPAIGETVFEDFPYLRPAQGCLPLDGTAIDLLVGYDHAYLITASRIISAPTKSDQHPSAAYTRLGWTIFGGAIPQPRAVVSNLSSVHHVQRLEEEDNLKALFYSDVTGVKPTSACVCSDKELAEASS